jgi:hypothetical protein
MDADAKENCEEILEMLEDEGIEGVLADDSASGVPEGVFEVRVPAPSAAAAEKLIAEESPEEEVREADPSSSLDLETIASAASEMEAMGIKSVLESNDIAAVLVGDSVLPNLAFDVRVARDQAARARQLLAEIEAAGPQPAEDAELESEAGG